MTKIVLHYDIQWHLAAPLHNESSQQNIIALRSKHNACVCECLCVLLASDRFFVIAVTSSVC